MSVFIQARVWAPMRDQFVAALRATRLNSVDEYAGASDHTFTKLSTGDDPNYGIVFYFDDPLAELHFRLKYGGTHYDTKTSNH